MKNFEFFFGNLDQLEVFFYVSFEQVKTFSAASFMKKRHISKFGKKLQIFSDNFFIFWIHKND